MTTFGELIESARNRCMTGWPDRINLLASDIDASTTTVQVTDPLASVAAGTRINIGTEDMLVRSVSSQTMTVIRGWGGSKPSSHSTSDVVYVAPSFSGFMLAQSVNQGLMSLTGDGLFKVASVTFDYNPAQMGYDLPAGDLLAVMDVRYDYPGPTREWQRLDRRDWYVDQVADTGDFPSGNQLVIRRGGFPGHKVKVVYKAHYTTLSDTSDDVEAVAGLHVEAHDLPPLYAAYQLQAGREVKRSLLTRQPEPRRQEEVPPGAAQGAMESLAVTYLDRVRVEADRLARRYPEGV